MGKYFRAQGRITPKWIIRSGPNSNSFELLCLTSFFHHSRARHSNMTGQIRPKFELVREFMPVLVTCKFHEDWIHCNWEKIETPFSPFKVNGNAQKREKSDPVQIQTHLRFCACPITYKFDKDPIKDDWENAETMSMSVGAFCCHGNHSFDPICPKT